MSQENFVGTSPLSFTAAGAITRGAALIFSAAAKSVVVSTAITQEVIGVALQDAVSGAEVPAITVSGTLVTMIAGAAITAGATVMPQAGGAGKVITAAGATAITCGIAMTAAGASGDPIEVLFRAGVKSPANT